MNQIQKTGDNIILFYQKSLGNDYYTDMTITLFSKTPISIFGQHLQFIWEGQHDNSPIKVSVLRSRPAESAEIEGLPNIVGLHQQVINEVVRILAHLN